MPDDAGSATGPENRSNPGYIDQVRAAIQAWQRSEPSVVAQIGNVLLKPVGWAVRAVLPSKALEGALSGADWAVRQILTTATHPDADDLKLCDAVAERVQRFHIALAAGEGGVAGFVGLPALPADIVAVVVLALRMIRQVGVEYGYSATDAPEQQFVLQVLSAAGANTMKEKAGAIVALQRISVVLARVPFKAMAEKAAVEAFGVEAGIMVVRGLAKQLGINLTKRKALEAIPFIGAAIGAATNGAFLRDVGIAAQRSYQERWLRDRDLLLDGEADPPPEH